MIEVTTGSAQRSYVNIAGAGFDSEVNETANGMRVRLGATGTYLAALLKTLSKFSPAAFTIQIDDERLELDAMLVEIGSGRWTGEGCGSSRSVHERRAARRVHRRGAVEAGVPPRVPAVFIGSHTTHPKVRMRTGTRVQVEANRRVPVYADGELVGPRPRSSRSVPPPCRWWSAPTPRPYGERMTTGLLLIHAFPLDATMWAPQVTALGARLPVVAPHLPGFGGTEGPEVLTMASAADACIRALDDAGVDRAVVCGLSMGGYVAFELWRAARPRIEALVLANTRAEPDAPKVRPGGARWPNDSGTRGTASSSSSRRRSSRITRRRSCGTG